MEYEQPAVRRIAPVSDGAAGFTAQVASPLAQAMISGIAGGLLAGVTCWGFISPSAAWPAALTVGAVSFSAAWLLLLTDSRGLLREQVIYSGGLPEPDKPTERLIPVIAPGANPQAIEQGERQERFKRFILACDRSTARRDLLRDFSEGELDEFKTVLVRLGYARDRGPDARQGWQLTGPAAELLRAMCL